MVQLAQNDLRAPAQAVVERGEAVEQDQCRAVDRDADDLPRIALQRSQHDQHDSAGDRQDGSDQMGDRVELFPVVHRVDRANDCRVWIYTGMFQFRTGSTGANRNDESSGNLNIWSLAHLIPI